MLIMGSNPLAKGSPMYDPPLHSTWLSYDPPPPFSKKRNGELDAKLRLWNARTAINNEWRLSYDTQCPTKAESAWTASICARLGSSILSSTAVPPSYNLWPWYYPSQMTLAMTHLQWSLCQVRLPAGHLLFPHRMSIYRRPAYTEHHTDEHLCSLSSKLFPAC